MPLCRVNQVAGIQLHCGARLVREMRRDDKIKTYVYSGFEENCREKEPKKSEKSRRMPYYFSKIILFLHLTRCSCNQWAAVNTYYQVTLTNTCTCVLAMYFVEA